jgi:predicted house-cleaning noncanonical NTP pyrophosphatase (MazG superfamily)
MKVYDKLVRDRIPEVIASRGGTCSTRVADTEEYGRRLIEKLHEEVEEFTRDKNAEELADILEVIRALCSHFGFDPKEVETLRAKKELERGSFKRRLVLMETD